MDSGLETKISSLERMADIFPYLVLLTYIAGCIFCIWIDRVSYIINGSILAFPAIIASFMFIAIKKRDIDLSMKEELFSHNLSTSPMLFSLFYLLTILILLFTPVDAKWGLFMIIALYTLIFIQILAWRLSPAVVLFEIMLTLAVTIYSYTLRPALYFGTTDILPHNYMSTITYLSGHVIPGELGTYTYFPLYHIFVAISSHILGLDIQTSHFITTGLVFSSTVLFLYYLVNSIFRNEQITLLVVLAYAMNADVVYYGTYMVTRTMAYVGFLVLLYLLYTMTSPKADTEHAITRPAARKIPAVIMTVFILLTHQISTPLIIILLGIIFVIEAIIHERRHVSPVFLMVPISLFAVYWTFTAYTFVEELFPHADPSLYQNVALTEVVHLGWSFLANQVDSVFIIFFALTGAIYLIWRQQPRYSIVFGILGLVAVILNVPNVISVIFQLASILRIDRFAILFLPILAAAMGFGIYIFARYLSLVRLPSRWVGVLLIVLVVLYGVGSLGITREESGDNRYSFDEDEIVGFDHVLRNVPSGSTLYSDYGTWRFFARKQIDVSERLGIPYYTSHLLNDDSGIPTGEERYIIFPDNQFKHAGLLFGEEEETFNPDEGLKLYLPTEENVRNVTSRLSAGDKIYSNNGADLYHYLH